jgi:DNA polymerase III alpha subunit
MLVEFARRARGAEPSVDIFPIFNKLFPETHGIMVYQEQLQRLYQEVTGCTGAEAEEFRGNVAKKKKEKIIAAYDGFITGATKVLGSKEQADAVWQFIQTWAAYGFNKSHSVCYCVIAYACAYLKRHYPLEWWCSVLKHAKKDEINSKFWRYCGDLIDLPDVLKSWPNFEIVGDRIQAPLTLMMGFGEGAQKELLELLAAAKPTTIGEFCQAVYDRRVANGEVVTKVKIKKKTNRKTGEVTETSVEEKRLKLAHSALHRGILYTLIVSGAMDSMFPPGTPVIQMLAEYEEALAKANKKKKVEAVKLEYNNITQYRRYQMRKRVLPAYSEKVLKMLIERKHENIFFAAGRGTWKYRGPQRMVSFASADEVEAMMVSADVPESGFRCAVPAFVDDVRVFSYSGGRRQACELMVDVDGARMKFVRWPDFESGELDPKYNEGLKGALVILTLYRHRAKKLFNVDDLEVVQPSLAFDDEVSPAEQSPEPTKETE